jgi:hypothetical protein
MEKPDVVDLGCGDFYVGSKIRSLCNHYAACDIVPSLIESNKKKFLDMEVDFRVLDLTEDEIPGAKVVFIRQVFQHLSNECIARAINNITHRFKILVLTEHLPVTPDFIPNLEKPTGANIRLCLDSGVVVTEPPFNLRPKGERLLCNIPAYGGTIRTTAYTLS